MNIAPLDWAAARARCRRGYPGDIRWIRLPVPGSLQHINVWLVPGINGRVLVDTGMNQPDTQAAWRAYRERAPRAGAARDPRDAPPSGPLRHGGALATRFGARAHERSARAPPQGSMASDVGAADGRSPSTARWGVDFAALLERARAAGVFGKLISGIPAQSSR